MSCSIIEQRIRDLEDQLQKFMDVNLENVAYEVIKGNEQIMTGFEKDKSNYFIEISLENVGRGYATDIAFKVQRDVDKMMLEKYGEAYTYGWVKIDNSHWKKLVIELTVPQSIEDARLSIETEIEQEQAVLDTFNTTSYTQTLISDSRTTSEKIADSELSYHDIVNEYEEVSTQQKVAPKQLSLDFAFDESKVTANAPIHSSNIKNIVIKHKKC
jgi:hypothetical protein